MQITQEQIEGVKTTLTAYLARLGIPMSRNRCRCPVHMGDSQTTCEIDTRTGIVMGMPTLLHCPKCNKTWDVISLHAELNGMDAKRDFVRICQELADMAGMRLDDHADAMPAQYRAAPKADADGGAAYRAAKDKAAAYIAECAARLDEARGYLEGRGISLDTARRFGLGYDSGFLVIPSGDGYSKRHCGECAPKDRYRKAPGLSPRGLGWDEIEGGQIAWVVEGEIDALSLWEAGQCAAGLGGKDAVNSFCNAMEKRPDFKTNPPKLILALDADDAGQKAQAALEEWAKAHAVPYSVLPGSWPELAGDASAKDANDALKIMGIDAFKDAVAREAEGFTDQKAREAARYLEGNLASRLHVLWNDAQNAKPPIPTGFADVDAILGGGMRPGVYVVGAIPSLGKTALVWQIACDMAARGTDVLYFSLEMPASDLTWRAVSRLSYLADRTQALTQRELQFRKWDSLGAARQSLATQSYDTFGRTAAPHIWIHESIGGLSVEELEAAISNHKSYRQGCELVCVVDYLQIMAPHEPHMTDKAALDYNALRLKQISNRYSVPMMVISSFNRANYASEAGFESFKESGAIEYCSDCLIALQLKAAIDARKASKGKDADQAVKDAIKEAKSNETREIEFVVLKNRMGRLTGDRGLFLSFTPKFNNFFAMQDNETF